MNKFEEEIKRRLAQSASAEGIDAESLWGSISEASYSVVEPKKKRRFAFIWFLLALLLAGSGWAIFAKSERYTSSYIPRSGDQIEIGNEFLSEVNSGQESTASTSVLQVEETNEIAAEQQLNNARLLSDVSRHDNQRSIENSEASDQLDEAKLRSSMIAEQNEQVNEKVDGISKTPISSDVMIAVASKNNVDVQHTSVVTSKNQMEVDAPAPQQFNQDLLSLVQIGVTSVALYPHVKAPFLKKQALPKPKTPITWTVYGGVVVSHVNYLAEESGLADSLNSNLNSDLGFHFGGMVQIKKQKNWNLSIGLEHMRLNDRFDKVLFSDTMVFVNQQEFSAMNIRTVRHYNNASVLTFPLQFELFKDLERFQVGMSLGAGYSLILGQQGRFLKDNNTVANYSQDEKRYANFLSVRLAPSIGYKLNGRMRLKASCVVGFQGHCSNSINQLNGRSIAVMPSIGITFN